jgi:protein-S-isoprenylcysteine O-methyltransferase Ste14
MKKYILNYLTLIIIIVAFPVLIIQYFKTGSPINSFTYIGLLLMLPSLVFFIIARIQLGSSFKILAEANKLVTNGIYKKIRHPIYFFGLIFLLGVIILLQLFYLLIIWCGLIFLQKRRIKNEERILEEKFGKQYLEYKKNTWF